MYHNMIAKSKTISTLPDCILSDVCHCDSVKSGIVFITAKQWKDINNRFFQREAEIFMNNATSIYSQRKKVPFGIAKLLLNIHARALSIKNNISFLIVLFILKRN